MTRSKKPASVPEEGAGAGPVQISYDVRIREIKELPPSKRTKGKPRYQVRWTVSGGEHSKNFSGKRLAEGHQAKLRTAANEGQPFDVVSGLPLSMLPKASEQKKQEPTWYEFAISYSKVKWKTVSAGHRRGIAEGLAAATLALVRWEEGHPDAADVHSALSTWAFNVSAHKDGLPAELHKVIRWVEAHSVNVTELEDTDLVRDVLVQLTLKLDGTKAASSTYTRKRATFFNALKYAVEKKYLTVNPLLIVSLPAAKSSDAVDRRRVVNEAAGRRLLIAAGKQGAMGRHLQAFYGCLFLAGLRPGEAVSLTEDEIDLPEDEEEWGWFHLADSSPEVSGAWTDSGEREIRQLKHRAAEETRPVPVSPLLGKLLRRHLREFGTAPDGRLFRGEDGGLVSESTTNRIWDLAREAVLTPAETRSVLAERPYDLRHARLSIWLNAGVDPAQISEWAGNSVPVLLRVYVHCLSDSQEAALAKLGRKSTAKTEEADLSELDRLLIGQDAPEPEPVSFYELAVAYIGAKWDGIAPTTRKGALETLTKVTVALLDRPDPWPTDVQLVQALTSWAFRPDRWGDVPDDHAKVIAWVAERSPDVGVLKDPERLKTVLAYLAKRLDGESASPNVAARRRSVLFNILEFAVRERHLPVNPLLFRSWGA